jgi:hypothetical protein
LIVKFGPDQCLSHVWQVTAHKSSQKSIEKKASLYLTSRSTYNLFSILRQFLLIYYHNGTPKIFEINSRHSGTTYIRSLFGFKEIEYIINLLLFDVEIDFNLNEGTVVRFYDEFFIPSAK